MSFFRQDPSRSLVRSAARLRVGLGVITMCGLILTLRGFDHLASDGVPMDVLFLSGLGFCLYAIPLVVDVSFSVTWGRWIRVSSIGALAVAAGAGWAGTENPFGPEMGMMAGVLVILTLGLLGPSFLMSGLLAVPG